MTYRVKLEKRESGTTHDGYCSDAETYEYSREFTETIEVSQEFYNDYILSDGVVTGEGLERLRVKLSGCNTGGSGYCGCKYKIECISGKLVTEEEK
jgi:hypothetical protein